MNSDSIRLAWAGAMIGVLALTATMAARSRPPTVRRAGETTAALLAAESRQASEPAGAGDFFDPEGEAIPAMAEQTKTEQSKTEQTKTEQTGAEQSEAEQSEAEQAGAEAGPFAVALRVTEPILGERLFLCDGSGSPLEELEPDEEGDAVLGPLPPGRYGVCVGAEEIGSFRLLANAALDEAAGRLWTDGELLHLERFVPGTARLRLRLAEPGYYTLLLFDRDGRSWGRDLYIAEDARPEEAEGWLRSLDFRGLPPGLYTVVRRAAPLGQLEVRAGETAVLELRIE